MMTNDFYIKLLMLKQIFCVMSSVESHHFWGHGFKKIIMLHIAIKLIELIC